MVPNFLSAVWHGDAFHRLGIQDVESLTLVDALFLLDGGRRREGKKKNCHGGGRFPGTGPILLAVLQVAAVRCN
jgi:hypothetical protein